MSAGTQIPINVLDLPDPEDAGNTAYKKSQLYASVTFHMTKIYTLSVLVGLKLGATFRKDKRRAQLRVCKVQIASVWNMNEVE